MITVGKESHAVPRDVVKRITRAGGFNLYGRPRFRVVWGGDRLDPLGFQRYAYSPTLLQRWIIEVWRPPTDYGSKSEWLKNEETLGPFPSQGDYEFLASVNTAENEFKQITPEIAEFAVEAYRKSREMSHWDRRALNLALAEQRERDYVTFADGVLDDATLPFYGRTAVYQS